MRGHLLRWCRLIQTLAHTRECQVYSTVRDIEDMFSDRHFTPDGHVVGGIGECLVADEYDFELMRGV